MVTNLESDYVEVTSGSVELGLKARLMTAGWFAGAACIPISLIFLLCGAMKFNSLSDLTFSHVLWFVWLIGTIPVSAAALMGFIFGCRIVDPFYPTTPGRAALRGTLVAFFSYVLFVMAYGVSITLLSTNYREASLSAAVSMMVVVFLFGFVLVGWLLLIVGALAGWLLYRTASNDPGRFLGVPGDSVETVNLWISIAIVLYLAICGGLWFVGKVGQP